MGLTEIWNNTSKLFQQNNLITTITYYIHANKMTMGSVKVEYIILEFMIIKLF